jgi:predicted TIM-barrel fold metal-dependent hydrolase
MNEEIVNRAQPRSSHPRYRGPVIDAHCHYDAITRSMAELVNRLGRLDMAIHLWDLSWPPNAPVEEAREWGGLEPPLVRCHNPDLRGVGGPGCEAALERGLREAAEHGCVGVKVWKHLGLWIEDASGQRLAIDDARLDVLWEVAAELRLPVAIHVGDPPAFFAPLDDDNPRIEELRVHPEWWYGGGDFPSLEQIHEELESVVASHPRTTFIGVHFGCFMAWRDVRRMLATYENYRVDTAAAIADMGAGDVTEVREILTAFPDRAIFGTDLIRTRDFDMPHLGEEGRWALADFFDAHWRFFETAASGLAHPLPAQGDWTVTGLDLPDDVLHRLYWHNAAEIFRLPVPVEPVETGSTA